MGRTGAGQKRGRGKRRTDTVQSGVMAGSGNGKDWDMSSRVRAGWGKVGSERGHGRGRARARAGQGHGRGRKV